MQLERVVGRGDASTQMERAAPDSSSAAGGGGDGWAAEWGLTAQNFPPAANAAAPPLASLNFSNLDTALHHVRSTLARHEESIREPSWLGDLQRRLSSMEASVEKTAAAQAQAQTQVQAAAATQAAAAPSPDEGHAAT